jgi:hypothetical protein
MNKKNQIKEIKAISVIQPWADIILHYGKNVENRKRNSYYRGYLAIYASKNSPNYYFDQAKEDWGINIKKEDTVFGHVLGFVKLVDVITKKQVTAKTKKYFQGKYGYVLTDVMKLKEPVPIKMGKRGVWTLKGKEFKNCYGQLSKSNQKKILQSVA